MTGVGRAILAVALFVAACSSGSDTDSGGSPPTVEPSTTPVAAVISGGENGDVVVAAGTVSPDVLESVQLEPVDGVPSSIRALTSARLDYGVTASSPSSVDGELGGSVLLTIPIAAPPTEDSVPGVLHVRDNGSFVLIPGLYDPANGAVSVWTDSFSNFFSGWWNPLNWVEEGIRAVGGAIDFVADWVTGRTDPPSCRNDSPSWLADAGSETPSLHVCFQSNTRDDGTERVEVFIKSNRSTMQAVTIPAGVDYLWMEAQPEWFRPVSSLVAGDFSPAPPSGIPDLQVSPQIVTLFGGESMSFGFTRPFVDTDVEMRAFQSELHIVANHLLGLIGGLEGSDVLLATTAAYACVSSVTGLELPAVSSPPDSLTDAIGVGVKCGLALLENPQLLADIVRVIAEELGFDGDQLIQLVASIASERVQRLAKALAAAINVGGAVVRVFDSIFDAVATGPISFTLLGSDPEQPGSDVSAPSVDALLNATLPAGTCGSIEDDIGRQLTDGQAQSDEPLSPFMALELDDAVVFDFTGDAIDDVAIRVFCTGGGTAAWTSILIWPSDGTMYVLESQYDVGLTDRFPEARLAWFSDLSVVDDRLLEFDWQAWLPTDANCCPSLSSSSRISISPDGATLISTAEISTQQ